MRVTATAAWSDALEFARQNIVEELRATLREVARCRFCGEWFLRPLRLCSSQAAIACDTPACQESAKRYAGELSDRAARKARR